jgi:histidinol dehydrogenase
MRVVEIIQNSSDIKELILGRKSISALKEREIADTILREVRDGGDAAVKKWNEKFCPLFSEPLRISEDTLRNAKVNKEFEVAVRAASSNIRAFHELQKRSEITFSPVKGIECRRVPQGIKRVGLYVPGGDTPLVSTLLMLAIPAQIAGCSEIVVCASAGANGRVAEELLWTLQFLGITESYAIGGAQAIGAMAYGTETISPVFKIAGPGSQYVNQAKLSVQQQGVCQIDIPAGPSEVVVAADADVNPSFVAADVISQAEHGEDIFTAVLSTDPTYLESVQQEIQRQLTLRTRYNILQKSLKETRYICTPNYEISRELIQSLAPEHVILMGETMEKLSNELSAVGSIFVGRFTPESLGDYLSGMNHVLPTGKGARGCSGVSVETFTKWVGVQSSTREGLEAVGKAIVTLAMAENLDGHAYAVEVRLQSGR